MGTEWREQRERAAAVHAAAAAREREREAGQARRLVADFVRQARAGGLPATRLRATAYGGGASYRTSLHGWYLKRDRSLAAGLDGELYLLTVPAGWRARLTGAAPTPYEPRLVIGRGGRDGESIPLEVLLQRRLDAGPDWP